MNETHNGFFSIGPPLAGVGSLGFRVSPMKLGCKISLNKGCVTLCGLAIYIKKHLKAKEELRKLKYFTMQKYNL
jgi:hypothetical protein